MFKTTSMGMPLCTSSAHPISVHRWPMTYLDTIRSLSSTSADASDSMQVMVQRFISHQANPYIINQMIAAKTNGARGTRALPKPKGATTQKYIWLVAGYHPVYRRAIPIALSKFQQSVWWKGLLTVAFGSEEKVPRIKLAWKNRLCNMKQITMNTLQRINGGWMGQDGG